MKIMLFKGTSFISRAIRFQTRSVYSHAAILDQSIVTESWHKGGVRQYPLEELRHNHKSGTGIDIYDIRGPYDVAAVRTFLSQAIGKKYDFKSIFRFLTRRRAQADDKYFCSELVLHAFAEGGFDILHIRPSEASPRDLSISPLLKLSYTITSR